MLPIRPPAPYPLKNSNSLLRLILALRRDPISAWQEQHFTEPFVGRHTLFGFGAVISNPIAIKHVLVTNAKNYKKDRFQLRLVTPGMGTGLFTSADSAWHRQRTALSPLFSNLYQKGHALSFEFAARRLVEKLTKYPEGMIIDIAPIIASAAITSLDETIFTRSLPQESMVFVDAIDRYLQNSGRLDLLDFFGAPNWIPRFSRIKGRTQLQLLNNIAKEMIANRRAANVVEEGPHDLLGCLLSAQSDGIGEPLSDDDIIANITTFIAAGHETTANSIIWSLLLISLDSSVREIVEMEVKNLDIGCIHPSDWHKHLSHTRAVLDEAMRLYPPAAMISREAIERDVLCGVSVPAGATIFMPPYVLHRHHLLWEHPDRFLPWKFLPLNKKEIQPFSYLPFGAGPRACVAMNFAIQEALIMLAVILRSFRIKAECDDIQPIQLITLRPFNGVKIRLEKY